MAQLKLHAIVPERDKVQRASREERMHRVRTLLRFNLEKLRTSEDLIVQYAFTRDPNQNGVLPIEITLKAGKDVDYLRIHHILTAVARNEPEFTINSAVITADKMNGVGNDHRLLEDYRALGSVEKLRERLSCPIDGTDVALRQELEQYKALGTLEGLRAMLTRSAKLELDIGAATELLDERTRAYEAQKKDLELKLQLSQDRVFAGEVDFARIKVASERILVSSFETNKENAKLRAIAETHRQVVSRLEECIEEKSRAFAELLENYDRANTEIQTLRESLKSRAELNDMNFTQFGVFFARQQYGDEYEKCAEEYSTRFPSGMPFELHRALELEKRDYVVNPEVIALANPSRAGIDVAPDASIDDILIESSERAKPFEESEFYQQNIKKYDASQGFLTAFSEAGEEVTAVAKQTVDAFDEQRTQWTLKQGEAAAIHSLVKQRSEQYDALRATAPLSLNIPIIAYGKKIEGNQHMYLILPSKDPKKSEDFTNMILYGVSAAVKQALPQLPITGHKLEETLGSPVIEVNLGNMSSREALSSVAQTYAVRTALGNLGARLNIFNLGEGAHD